VLLDVRDQNQAFGEPLVRGIWTRAAVVVDHPGKHPVVFSAQAIGCLHFAPSLTTDRSINRLSITFNSSGLASVT
jgi:hypothetical protein